MDGGNVGMTNEQIRTHLKNLTDTLSDRHAEITGEAAILSAKLIDIQLRENRGLRSPTNVSWTEKRMCRLISMMRNQFNRYNRTIDELECLKNDISHLT
jgi:hypothetical protein